ncbi:MAG TPA: flavodoxin domain-containing protein [Jatrophihabitans sp.]|jgi:hypothetical protein|nr:flavodoxin domain-containing protein [Jatrophihabitans sp.]
MRALVAYESMYGNTRQVAEAIAEGLTAGLGPDGKVSVCSLDLTTQPLQEELDLVVVGGPTHVHGMSRPRSRAAAAQQAAAEHLPMDASAPGPGLREWLGRVPLPERHCRSAAFDTRVDAPALVTGRAAPKIQKLLRRRGLLPLLPPESFLVDRRSRLRDGELDRAREWGGRLARVLRDASASAVKR